MSFSPPWSAYTALLVAVVSLAIALLVLGARPREAANQFFAFFMALIAGNFAAQFLQLGLTHVPGAPSGWADAGALFLIWDPAILVYFVSVFPRRTFFARHGAAQVALAAVPTVFTILLLADPVAFPDPVHWQKRALIAYLALAYLFCLASLILSDVGPPGSARARQANALMIGFGVALLPRFGLVADDLQWLESYSAAAAIFRTAVMWILFGGAWLLSRWATRRARDGRPRGLANRDAFAWTAGLLGIFTVLWFAGIVIGPRINSPGSGQLNLYYPFRWILFAIVVGYAIAKFQVFDIEIRLKRVLHAAAPVLLAAAVFGLAFLSFALVGRPGSVAGGGTAPWIAAALAVAIAVVLHRPATQLADRLFPRVTSDESYVRGRKLEVYGAQLEAAAAEGRLGPRPDAALEALRRRLGITPEEHETLERLVRRASAVPARLEDRIASGDPLFGRYRVVRRLDSGGFADVFLATDLRQEAPVVIKRLHPGLRQDERVLKSFLREAEVAGRIRHPNVVAVHEVLEDRGEVYLVLDYVEGGSLADVLGRDRCKEPSEATRIVQDVLRGLDAVHAEGVFHRDLKPANVLLAADGRALITDFGVAHVPSLEETLVGPGSGPAHPGTLAYMAPEQAEGRPVDGRADIYAMGAILYELLTGERLQPVAKGEGEFEARRRIARGVPAGRLKLLRDPWRTIVATAVATRPEDRYAGPAAMLDALQEAAAGLPEKT